MRLHSITQSNTTTTAGSDEIPKIVVNRKNSTPDDLSRRLQLCFGPQEQVVKPDGWQDDLLVSHVEPKAPTVDMTALLTDVQPCTPLSSLPDKRFTFPKHTQDAADRKEPSSPTPARSQGWSLQRFTGSGGVRDAGVSQSPSQSGRVIKTYASSPDNSSTDTNEMLAEVLQPHPLSPGPLTKHRDYPVQFRTVVPKEVTSAMSPFGAISPSDPMGLYAGRSITPLGILSEVNPPSPHGEVPVRLKPSVDTSKSSATNSDQFRLSRLKGAPTVDASDDDALSSSEDDQPTEKWKKRKSPTLLTSKERQAMFNKRANISKSTDNSCPYAEGNINLPGARVRKIVRPDSSGDSVRRRSAVFREIEAKTTSNSDDDLSAGEVTSQVLAPRSSLIAELDLSSEEEISEPRKALAVIPEKSPVRCCPIPPHSLISTEGGKSGHRTPGKPLMSPTTLAAKKPAVVFTATDRPRITVKIDLAMLRRKPGNTASFISPTRHASASAVSESLQNDRDAAPLIASAASEDVVVEMVAADENHCLPASLLEAKKSTSVPIETGFGSCVGDDCSQLPQCVAEEEILVTAAPVVETCESSGSKEEDAVAPVTQSSPAVTTHSLSEIVSKMNASTISSMATIPKVASSRKALSPKTSTTPLKTSSIPSKSSAISPKTISIPPKNSALPPIENKPPAVRLTAPLPKAVEKIICAAKCAEPVDMDISPAYSSPGTPTLITLGVGAPKRGREDSTSEAVGGAETDSDMDEGLGNVSTSPELIQTNRLERRRNQKTKIRRRETNSHDTQTSPPIRWETVYKAEDLDSDQAYTTKATGVKHQADAKIKECAASAHRLYLEAALFFVLRLCVLEQKGGRGTTFAAAVDQVYRWVGWLANLVEADKEVLSPVLYLKAILTYKLYECRKTETNAARRFLETAQRDPSVWSESASTPSPASQSSGDSGSHSGRQPRARVVLAEYMKFTSKLIDADKFWECAQQEAKDREAFYANFSPPIHLRVSMLQLAGFLASSLSRLKDTAGERPIT